jgi:enoyl-CoA hydratase/carnithine racemase
MTDQEQVYFEVKGGLGIITLNRPKALNAINRDMCSAIDQMLEKWETNDAVQAVLIRGAGDKAFCAGGDVKSLVEGGVKNAAVSQEFFRTEYKMNARIFHFSKPYIALLDGVTMGGGVGLSVHGSHPIVTEKTLFAMPEAAIGLIPDVGGSYFLPRLVGKTGLYLGLTGARLGAADMLYVGIGAAFIKSENLESFTQDLVEADLKTSGDVDHIIARFAEIAQEAPLDEYRDIIDAAFDEESLDDVLDHLKAIDHDMAQETLTNILGKSNMSIRVIFEQLKQGGSLEFDECLKIEYNIVSNLVRQESDFYRGVRSVLIDKDHNPAWQPDKLDDVTDEMVLNHFKTPKEGGLTLS